jgi:hypothetical protein
MKLHQSLTQFPRWIHQKRSTISGKNTSLPLRGSVQIRNASQPSCSISVSPLWDGALLASALSPNRSFIPARFYAQRSQPTHTPSPWLTTTQVALRRMPFYAARSAEFPLTRRSWVRHKKVRVFHLEKRIPLRSFRTEGLSGSPEFHPAPAERGLGALLPCLEAVPGLQSPCECALSDLETQGSFPLRCRRR